MQLPSPARGVLSVHPRGFGFLDLAERDESAFVPPPALRGFLQGDEVEAELTPDDRGVTASKLKLVSRWREALYGTLVERRGKRFLRPDPQVASSDWPLRDAPQELERDACLVARIEGDEVVFERSVPEDERPLTATLVRWGIRAEFPEDALAEARAGELPSWEGRRDLREVPTLTIDAPTSRDLDDALSALPAQPDGAVRVFVSIADVDALVPEGSALDREARGRATSTYLPGHVVPMLPRELSEGLLSLLPEQERATVTIELRIDCDGAVTARDVYLSRLRSHARLSYAGVAAFLDQDDPSGVPPELQETLRWLRTAASRLGVVRKARGGLEIQREEVGLKLDEDGRASEVVPRHENSAHRLVERLMVAANEGVAAWLAERGLPALYRVQDEPDPERVATLAEFARNFGFLPAFGDRLTPRGLAAFQEQFQTSDVAPQVRTVLRRVLGRARYQVQPAGHFALASPGYLHFTSPIRRYADLSVHRILKAHLAGDREQVAGDPRLGELAEELDGRARRASRAEDDRFRQLVAELFQGQLGETFTGHVIAVRSNRLSVQLLGTGVRGSLPIEELPGGPLELEPERETLRGEGVSYVVGQRLQVVLRETDPEAGRIVLGIAEDGE